MDSFVVFQMFFVRQYGETALLVFFRIIHLGQKAYLFFIALRILPIDFSPAFSGKTNRYPTPIHLLLIVVRLQSLNALCRQIICRVQIRQTHMIHPVRIHGFIVRKSVLSPAVGVLLCVQHAYIYRHICQRIFPGQVSIVSRQILHEYQQYKSGNCQTQGRTLPVGKPLPEGKRRHHLHENAGDQPEHHDSKEVPSHAHPHGIEEPASHQARRNAHQELERQPHPGKRQRPVRSLRRTRPVQKQRKRAEPGSDQETDQYMHRPSFPIHRQTCIKTQRRQNRPGIFQPGTMHIGAQEGIHQAHPQKPHKNTI